MSNKNSNNELGPEQNSSHKAQPQKNWDERPGQRDSDPKTQQEQRVWEEAQKQQEKNAERTGMDKNDLKQHDRQGNPTDRGENFQEEA